jgi:calcineurin-like phosphoesterase family protein
MNEEMVRLWNERIGPSDIVYHLGDFAVTDEALEEFSARLNGRIILVMGNHDVPRDKALLKRCFSKVCKDPFALTVAGSGQDVPLWLCHYPKQRRAAHYTVSGHVHSLWQVARDMLNVGVEVHYFRPISLEKVLACRENQELGRWDANVFPDASLEWQMEVSSKIVRVGCEPTLDILQQEMWAERKAKEKAE